METAVSKAIDIVLSKGFEGVVTFCLVMVIIALYKRNNELQNLRFTDARELLNAVAENSRVLERLTEAVKTSNTFRGSRND